MTIEKHTCKYSLSLINVGCKLNWKWKHRQEACQGILILLLITELFLCVLHTCVALINSHKVLQRKFTFLPLCVYNHGLGIAKKKLFIGKNSSRNVWIMVIHVDLRLYSGFATCQILHVRLKYPHKRHAALKTFPWKNIQEGFFLGWLTYCMYIVLFDGLKQKLMCRKWSR